MLSYSVSLHAQAVPATQREERLRDRQGEDAAKAKKAWACSITSGTGAVLMPGMPMPEQWSDNIAMPMPMPPALASSS